MKASAATLLVFFLIASGSPATASGPSDPFLAAYTQSMSRMSQPDQTLSSVSFRPTASLSRGVYASSSKTCSQRCSTTCSVSCTTTRGCSSTCKKQTDGCGGDSGSNPPKDQPKADTQIVDINRATMEELLALPGIGEAYAKKIIANRPFRVKSELLSKDIVPQATYDKVKAWIIAKQ